MDNLVLIRVAACLARSLERAALREVRADAPRRLRLVFEGVARPLSVIVSLRPELPWIGRPAGRREPSPLPAGRFASRVQRALHGARLAALEKALDRRITFRFADGQALVAELATHGANLLLLDAEGRLMASARRPRSAARRLVPGHPYRPAELPRRLLSPVGADPAAIDTYLDRAVAGGESYFEALRRRIFGVGSEGARLILEESRRAGASPGAVLAERLGRLERGECDPVIEASGDPLEAAAAGTLDPASVRLLPWEPLDPPLAGTLRIARADPAGTAGLYHEAMELAALVAERGAALRSLLDRELDRVEQAERAVGADLESFEDPEKYRQWGEALLAGLGRARRVESGVFVPDPYDEREAETLVPAKPGLSLQRVAEELFRRHRRARRGLDQARARAEGLAARRERLQELARRHEKLDAATNATLERAMREAGIPVGLEPRTRAARAAARLVPPRLEGVRLFRSRDGLTILAGRSGKDNHRLTFQLAGPEDFWFHALGCTGAHVVVRNEGRGARPPQATLEQAAAVAAWFSEARNQPRADVQWTRRKYVRRLRGAPPGTVVLKRFETLRVRPGLPAGE